MTVTTEDWEYMLQIGRFVDATIPKKTELELIASMLEVASECGLEAEVVLELCNTFRQASDTTMARATMDAMVEWDL